MVNESGTVRGTSCWLGNYLKETKRKKQVNNLRSAKEKGAVLSIVKVISTRQIHTCVVVQSPLTPHQAPPQDIIGSDTDSAPVPNV